MKLLSPRPGPPVGIDPLVMMLDRDQVVSWVNEVIEQVTGWTATELRGRRLALIQRQLGLNLDLTQVGRTFVDGQGWSADLRLRTRGGELRRLHARVSAVRGWDDQIVGVLVTARDETELCQLRSVAEAVNLATNVGQMFAGIRHELGNPVNSLKTALTVLRSRWREFEPEHVDHYHERMLIEVGRVEYLLRSLRSFSAFEDLQLHRVSIDQSLAEIERVVTRPASDRGVTLTVEAEPGLAVTTDERALYQVWLNLVTNAMDAVTEARGTIVLRARRLPSATVALEVIDDGEGIPPPRLELIRRPFFTTKAHGTGLGLTIVDRLVAEMNGELVIESRPGRTAVRVLLEELDA